MANTQQVGVTALRWTPPFFRKTSTRKAPLKLLILEPVPYGRGKSKPRYRASPTEIKTLITRALGMKWQPALPLVA